MGRPVMSLTTNLHCVTFQKSEGLLYTEEEAPNHELNAAILFKHYTREEAPNHELNATILFKHYTGEEAPNHELNAAILFKYYSTLYCMFLLISPSAGRQSELACGVQVPRSVWQLHDEDLLEDAACFSSDR